MLQAFLSAAFISKKIWEIWDSLWRRPNIPSMNVEKEGEFFRELKMILVRHMDLITFCYSFERTDKYRKKYLTLDKAQPSAKIWHFYRRHCHRKILPSNAK